MERYNGERKIRLATIGTNFITERFLEAVELVDEIEYAVTYSRDAQKGNAFAKKHGAKRVITDLMELAQDSEVDAVYVASPNALHCEQSVLMMNHGKHVLCEKPAASNEAELVYMLEAAKQNDVVFLEAIKNVLDPGFELVKEHLPRLGKVRRVYFEFSRYSSRYEQFQQGIVENAFRPELSNGALMDIGVYCVHPLLMLFGKPENIYADGIILPDSIDGTGTIFAKYPDMQAQLCYSKISDGWMGSQIQGEDATMVIDKISDIKEIKIYDREGKFQILQAPKNICMYYETKKWAKFILDGGKIDEYHKYSRMALELMDEARSQMKIVFPADNNVRIDCI